MGKTKKVSRPQYEQWAGNEYTDALREDLPTYRDQYNYMLGQLDVTSPEVQQQFQNIANDYTQAQWNDYNRNALANMKAMNQANYNRFGNLGSSGAMYGNDTLNRQLNDLATRIAGQTAGQYQNLINNYYNQKLSTAQMYGSAYNNAGDFLTKQLDQPNWKVRLQNQENAYLDDVDRNSSKFSLGNTLSGALSGAASGFSMGGPWGALAGGVLGGAAGALSGGDGNSASQLGSTFGNLGGSATNNWLNSKGNVSQGLTRQGFNYI